MFMKMASSVDVRISDAQNIGLCSFKAFLNDSVFTCSYLNVSYKNIRVFLPLTQLEIAVTSR